MYLGLLVAVCFSVLFYRAALYERMSPLLWGVASFALSMAVTGLHGGIIAVMLAQIGLFAAMTWYNASRKQQH